MWVVALVAALAAIIFVASRTGESDGELKALREDPMSSWRPDGAIDERRFENARSDGSTSKARPPSILRTISLPDDGSAEAVFDEARRVTAGVGWDIQFEDGSGFVAWRTTRGRQIRCTVTVSTNSDNRLVLTIGLDGT